MIDWVRVLQMYNDVGAQEFGPLVALFLEEAEGRLTHLGASPAQLLLDLHYLRGSALNLGFTNFGDLCLRAEDQLVDGQFDQVSRDDLIAAFTAARRSFLHDLDWVLGAAGARDTGVG